MFWSTRAYSATWCAVFCPGYSRLVVQNHGPIPVYAHPVGAQYLALGGFQLSFRFALPRGGVILGKGRMGDYCVYCPGNALGFFPREKTRAQCARNGSVHSLGVRYVRKHLVYPVAALHCFGGRGSPDFFPVEVYPKALAPRGAVPSLHREEIGCFLPFVRRGALSYAVCVDALRIVLVYDIDISQEITEIFAHGAARNVRTGKDVELSLGPG